MDYQKRLGEETAEGPVKETPAGGAGEETPAGGAGEETPASLDEEEKWIQLERNCKNVWRRARHNAFAHKIAARRARRWANCLFVTEFVTSILGIFFIILTYMILSSDILTSSFSWQITDDLSVIIDKKSISFATTLLSVLFSMFGIFASVFNNYLRFDSREEEHLHALGSYQYIAQKTRFILSPEVPYENMIKMMEALEENFQILKARGREPSDRDFKKGLRLMKKIAHNPESSAARSFNNQS